MTRPAQRFGTGSVTPVHARRDTGSQPIRLEPEPPAALACADVRIPPRLLNLKQVAQYLGVSYWSARDYVLAGQLPAVRLPPLRAREGDRARDNLRRVLVDVRDLDRFIEARKADAAGDLQSSAPQIGADEPV